MLFPAWKKARSASLGSGIFSGLDPVATVAAREIGYRLTVTMARLSLNEAATDGPAEFLQFKPVHEEITQ
jgi:hypothetical protein